jgi:NAD(P)-dependent dehydrogenase (short-subunit alcohol dehydrogenase family)
MSLLLTGPTGGLGSATAEALAARAPDAPLLLLGRDERALAGRAADLRARDVRPIHLDLASTTSVHEAADEIRSLVDSGEVPPLGAVVLNAGVQAGGREHRTAQGLELTFGVNVVAQHALVCAVLDVLAHDAHVVLVGSGTHHRDRSELLVPHPRWEDPAELARPGGGDADRAGQRAYATSKLAVVHLAHELHRRCGDRIRVNVYDPGLMPGTGLARDLNRLRRLLWFRVLPHLHLPGTSTPARSAGELADLALGLRHPDLRNGYVDIDRVVEPSPESFDETRERRLWEVCEHLGRRPAPT